jgi:hypothetical protein
MSLLTLKTINWQALLIDLNTFYNIKRMKRIINIGFLSVFFLISMNARSQVLITLLLGDALNTPNIEFGLSGGLTHSYIGTISNSDGMNTLDLGFYFHILMKKNSYLSTGVHVKSNMGGTGMPVYSLDDPDFDAVYKDGTLTKKIPAFYVPVLFHQRFNQRWYIEAGPQLGLIHKPVDIFEAEKLGGDLKFTLDVKDQYKYIDAGLLAGIGFKFSKQPKSMSAGASYYYGLIDVSLNPDYKIKNQAFYFFIKIPIGVAPKKPDQVK